MALPKLQLALDTDTLITALDVVQKVSEEIDVIEVGTVLVLQEGINSVRTIRALYPNHIILSDVRIIKAGGKLSKICFENGANWITVISDASKDTIESVVKESKKYKDTDIQIEINESYDDDQLDYFKSLGITQIIYHRSSEIKDEEKKWSQSTLDEIKRLANKGFRVSITGGLDIDEIKLFKDIPVYCFIVGRKICKDLDPKRVAKEYKNEILRVFS